MAVLITARLLAVFKSNRSCHALPSINRVISCPRSLKWRRYCMHLLRRFRSPSSCSCRPRLHAFLFLVLCTIPGLPPPALWSEIEEEVCTAATYSRVGGIVMRAGSRCCVHREYTFLDIIRYHKPMALFRRF